MLDSTSTTKKLFHTSALFKQNCFVLHKRLAQENRYKILEQDKSDLNLFQMSKETVHSDEVLLGEPKKDRSGGLKKILIVLGIVIIALISLVVAIVSTNDSDPIPEYCEKGDKNCWDMLGITVNWPETSCRQMNRSHHICHEPSNLDDWTIHGLWPNRMSGGWPQYCTREQFDPNEIKDLIPEMDKDWPNLMQDRPHYDFWTHEYEKHGTCAETLPGK